MEFFRYSLSYSFNLGNLSTFPSIRCDCCSNVFKKKNRLCLGYVTIFSVSLLKSQLAVIDQRAPELMEFMKNIKRDTAKESMEHICSNVNVYVC